MTTLDFSNHMNSVALAQYCSFYCSIFTRLLYNYIWLKCTLYESDTVNTVLHIFSHLFSTLDNSNSRYLEPFSISLEGSSYRESTVVIPYAYKLFFCCSVTMEAKLRLCLWLIILGTITVQAARLGNQEENSMNVHSNGQWSCKYFQRFMMTVSC